MADDAGVQPLLPSLCAADRAPRARTLVDIFREVAEFAPQAPAIDSGVTVLTYDELAEAADRVAAELRQAGVQVGDKVGVRINSGTTDLYVAILGILCAGAAYVPVDADDPDDRARVVFDESGAVAVVGSDLQIERRQPLATSAPAVQGDSGPSADIDAWVIFTSGSSGKPKGVAVTHRNAAAFVDAESRLFLVDEPIGPGDRVMAGLSVAFDASCEEMWLAWAYGACLVPAPRSLVRSGVDVGPWLVANAITVVSTVPTLVALWPPSSLDRVRLLIMGGEACPPELAVRLQRPGREVWNTYGPTEATVVACAALLDGSEPVRIGLPLDGWDLAVVDSEGHPVAEGGTGELIIGGVGLARYLDEAKDAEKYAAMPTLGWPRAYRSGDVVRNDPQGLVFVGRADDQVKLGGRRIELGEVDEHLLRLPGVQQAAAAVKSTASGNRLLVGYLTVDASYDARTAQELLRGRLPAALVPRLAVVEEMPTRTSGKIDRDALPWPLRPSAVRTARLSETQQFLADIWADVLGADVTSPRDDFFDFGGGSLTAAQVVSRIRERYPDIVVGDVYAHHTLAALADILPALTRTQPVSNRQVRPLPLKTQAGQLIALVPLRSLAGLRWLSWLLLGSALAGPALELEGLPQAPLWVIILTTCIFLVPPGRMALAALLARSVLGPVTPGEHPRGGKIHLRIWLAERIQDELAATSLAGAPWFPLYARLLGNTIGQGVDLHSVPPVTGMLSVGNSAAIEPEVDLAGHWIDGDVLHVGAMKVGARARVGARCMLGPGSSVGKDAEVAPGSLVLGAVPSGEFWAGSPATQRRIEARGPWQDPPVGRQASTESAWLGVYGLLAVLIAALPVASVLLGAGVLLPAVREAEGLSEAIRRGLPWLPLAVVVGYASLALMIVVLVRSLGAGMQPGFHRVRSATGVRIWSTLRVLDEARTWLFPLYASSLTPTWLRLLGARVGRGVEASTVLLIPKFTTVGDDAFLADDTLVGCYELGGGWIRVDQVKIGKRAFVGNSGMAAPGRKVPKESLVAVLSAAPARQVAKSGSSWMGSPPTRLRRTATVTDDRLTYAPATRLRVARGFVELLRVVPLLLLALLHVGIGVTLLALLEVHALLAVLLAGPVLIIAGMAAALLTVAAKLLLVGRHRADDHALWSSFVWRNELADTFTEVLAAPWFAAPAQGTVALNVWLRMLGARIGTGVWCDTYWLPETDLVALEDGATVNRGCVVQTHLFHDRVLSMDTVTLKEGATLGPNSVILPAATIGRHATVGPVSLVMRGEGVPSRTCWIGNPIGPWEAP
ncbi:amino acid adenylation domain-containing protein [Nocardioides glacieisoli]|uniref:Amino acid adenylation domain-containing protein n=1 Tax=Nocardioides glacieisoli TaxID=1168730 RepID=A0A4Q2S3A5_9ACTN|nr:Pls/PosA family non-ribosomal peptide synthetase [Nocardioides glacieisoli]RYB96038.1 amino acid adenylation domain-containing protein [Nocardioides glacieisoli]